MKSDSNLKLWRRFQVNSRGVLGSSLPTIDSSYKRVALIVAISSFFKKQTRLFSYQQSQLTNSLKKRINQTLLKERVSLNEMLIVQGGQSALFNLFFLMQARQPFLIERYNYVGLFHLFEVFNIDYVVVPNLYQLKPSQIENLIKEHQPGLFYLQPDNANPTGMSLNLSQRKKLAELSDKYKFKIIEDQAYRYLTLKQDLLPSLYELAPVNTITVGSLSKIFYPALRIGWITANPDLIKKIDFFQEVRNLSHSNLLLDMALVLLNRQQLLAKHIGLYQRRMARTTAFFANCSNSEVVGQPAGGYFIWLKMVNLDINQRKQLAQLLPHSKIFDYEPGGEVEYYRLGLGQINDDKLEFSLKEVRSIIG
ncbi:MAG: aminotransferase class I/II-fold pyridoxal phosphate-dependent enzyme [Patescibacteria group bacterium]|nr:aminotransferase class I/II-fold pyridoxal phosphate-dependent enzyme [Patescibacteria group bacterium]